MELEMMEMEMEAIEIGEKMKFILVDPSGRRRT